MKITSTCEKEFILKCTKKNYRLDGRSLLEGRTLDIMFGQEWGCCMVLLGNTRVLSQVSAEVVEPKAVSPTEGGLHINLDISSMSAPDVQYQSRISDEAVESQRILERCIRDSKCIDLESLCIVAGLKVWNIRVDIHAMNDDGNLVECSSIAAISALAHFKRPGVTVVGTEVTIHALDDREPAPLNLHHMPISVNLALFDKGEHVLVDPLEIEERIADGCYIIGINAHQEICLIHRRGVLLLSVDTIQKCEDIATKRSQTVTQVIRSALDDDAYKRATNSSVGFVNIIQTGSILGSKHPIKKVDLHEISKVAQTSEQADVIESRPQPKTAPLEVSQAKLRALKVLKEAETLVFEGGTSKWNTSEKESSEEDSSEEEMSSKNELSEITMKKETETGSSEDEAVGVSADHLDLKPSCTRGWYSKDPFA